MKILLVGNYEPSGQKSIQRFAALLESGFKAAGHETRIIRPPVVTGALVGGAGVKRAVEDQPSTNSRSYKRSLDNELGRSFYLLACKQANFLEYDKTKEDSHL